MISKAGPYYTHKTVVFEGWCAHGDSCTVCQHYTTLQRGGRPPKTKKQGRPPAISSRYCIQHIRQVAPPPFTSPDLKVRVCEQHLGVSNASEFNCPICLEVLRSPIQLVTCGSVVCAECLCSKVQDTLVCPCCSLDHLQDFTSIKTAPPLVVNVIGGLCIVCEKCHNHIKLKNYNSHLCTTSPQQVLPHTSIDEILNQPLTAPLSALEQKLQTNLARRSSDEGILQLKTGGKVQPHNNYYNFNLMF